MEGAYNVRDLGGYPTVDGRSTRWRTFLRADGLHRLTSDDQDRLVQYGVRTVVDLRKTWEVEESPNVFTGSSRVRYRHHNLLGDDPIEQPGSEVPKQVAGYVGPDGLVANTYPVWLDNMQDRVADVLATLAAPGALPAVFHCTAGKDRTGVISALLLGLAGVPAETIAADYTLSASRLFDVYVREVAPPDLSDTYSEEDYRRDQCPPEAMLETLSHLDDRYGGAEFYVRDCGLNDSQVESLRKAVVAPL